MKGIVIGYVLASILGFVNAGMSAASGDFTETLAWVGCGFLSLMVAAARLMIGETKTPRSEERGA